MLIDELASRVFAARDVAHRAHWATKSYSEHMALGAFYDDVIENIDAIVEAYQGEHGLIGNFSVVVPAVSNVVGYLKREAEWIADNRTAISQGCTMIQNLIDGLSETYRTTIYKLVNLK